MSDKQRKVFKIIIICLAIFLIAELIYFGIRYYINRQNSTYYSVVNDIVLIDKGYVGAGFSDYKNSEDEEEAFISDFSDVLRVLYTVNKYSEGVHQEDINVLIMGRGTSSVPLYSLNFAPAKYSTSVPASAVSAFAISSSSLTVLSVVFFTLINCILYVGIFSFSNTILIVGILSSSIVVWLAIIPSVVSIV